jgi:nitrous oxidase accessory protein
MRDGRCSEVELIYYYIGRNIVLLILTILINLTICTHSATLAVGGSPIGYESIQKAINSASEGDEILVYPGTYYENIVVDKRLDLIGLKNPIIDAGGDYAKGSGVTLIADGVLMEGFTIRNSTNTAGDPLSSAGVLVRSNNNTIKGNILENNYRSGIKVLNGYNNSIINNSVHSNFEGILVSDSHRNKIVSNCINNNNGTGIFIMRYSEQNLVTDNIINNNSQGVLLIDAGFNEINKNAFFGNRNIEKNIEIFYANF